MKDKEMTLWGTHGGRTGDADALFLTRNVIAVGWDKMGYVGKMKPDPETFNGALAAAYPNAKPGAIPNSAGQLCGRMSTGGACRPLTDAATITGAVPRSDEFIRTRPHI